MVRIEKMKDLCSGVAVALLLVNAVFVLVHW